MADPAYDGETDEVHPRLQQLLILGGLGLFIMAMAVAGVFGGLPDLAPDDDGGLEATPTGDEEPPAGDEGGGVTIGELDVPRSVPVGEPVEGTFTIENGGEGSLEDEAVVIVNGTEVAREPVTVDAGGSVPVDFAFGTDDRAAGPVTVEVAVGDANETSTVLLTDGEEAPPAFLVTEFEADDEVEVGEDIEVEFEVENAGDTAGTDDVNVTFGGDTVDTETVSLEGGETSEFEYEIDTDGYAPDEHRLNVSTTDDTVETSVTLEDDDDDDDDEAPPEFAINDLDVSDEVEAGEEIEVEFAVENVGDVAGETDITVAFDGSVEAAETVSIDGGSDQEFELGIDTDGRDAGDYPVTVTTDDDVAETTVTVTEDDDDDDDDEEGEVAIEDLAAPEQVEAGSTFETSFTVTNGGDSPVIEDVIVQYGGVEHHTQTVFLTPGDSTTITTEIDTGGYQPGSHDLVATAGDARATTEVVLQGGSDGNSTNSTSAITR